MILKPIFPENLDNADFLLSKLICVVEIDKRDADIDECIGSNGFFAKYIGIMRICP